jgi:hypothetical protein
MPRYPATKVPPICENISIDLAQQVLAESWGNIAQAADALGVPSRDLRFLVRATPALAAVAEEACELYCDRAEGILRDALESENELRRDVAARFVPSGKGAPRGWSRPSGPAVTIEQQPSRQIVIKWLGEDETTPREASEASPALIDARPVEGDDQSSKRTLRRSPEDVGDRLIEHHFGSCAAKSNIEKRSKGYCGVGWLDYEPSWNFALVLHSRRPRRPSISGKRNGRGTGDRAAFPFTPPRGYPSWSWGRESLQARHNP